MKIKQVEEIKEFLTPIANQVGVEIAEVEFKQGKNPALTVYIDKDGGIDLDLCEKFHNAIFDPLDELDPTFGVAYTLNVSSLGIDRPFKTEKDYLSHIDKKVEVKTKNSIKGKKFFDGILLKYDGKNIVVKVDEKTTLSLELKNVEKVNEYIDFE
ncbi:MAG: ribosome maturation factor RimP [Clostridia bacterium]|nr:ribosome maturation factor RimP [Clostridia bacterium]